MASEAGMRSRRAQLLTPSLRLVAVLLAIGATGCARGRVTNVPDLPTGGVNGAPLEIGESYVLPSSVLGESRRINVYVPAGYRAPTAPRLPVMYMPDGGMAEDFLHVAGIIQVSVGNGTMRPFILVGIENTERRRDLTGPTSNAEDRKIAPRVGGSAAFRTFIRTELMPFVESRYRTTDERAIVGESLAGLFVMETLLIAPDMFDTWIAFDPSLWWNHRVLVAAARARLPDGLSTPEVLYFASSDEPEIVADAQRMADVLQRGAPANLSWHYERMPEEKHSTIYHPAALRAFRRLFPPPPAPPGR